jgi:murein L,D-transpeptidase YcbB/YkuD
MDIFSKSSFTKRTDRDDKPKYSGVFLKRVIHICLMIFSLSTLSMGAQNEEISKEITYTLESRFKSRFSPLVKEIYRLNRYAPLWTGDRNAERFSLLLKVLASPVYNYKNKNFNRKEIKSLAFRIDNGGFPSMEEPKALARLDVMMSDALMRLLYFMRRGDVDWELVQKKLLVLKEKQDIHAVWEIKPKSMPTAKEIYTTLSKNDLAKFLEAQLPLKKRYISLLEMFYKYRNMPKFHKISTGRKLKVGSTDGRLPDIKKRLKFFGDYPKGEPEDNQFDRTLSEAVKRFRARFKLPDGNYIDNKMIFYLNKGRDYYLKKILVNLDKMKLYPYSFEKRYVEVNVPEFKMRFYENGEKRFDSDVVVGRIDRPTPIFDGKMTYMVLNPTWNIPDNLVRRDLIPMLEKEPDYLVKHNIHVYDSYRKGAKEIEPDMAKLIEAKDPNVPIPYRFVQFPSEKNALGRVKFMFPNRYSVYLHDTDNKKLFGYRYRVFSSGCMRMEKPFEFMNILLSYAKGSYPKSKIEEILESNEPYTIRLKETIPVHIVYFTARKEGDMDYFFYDIYLHDQIIWESTDGHRKETFKVPSNRLDPLHKKRKKRSFF